ncbi:MAG: MarR family transcriptional regulator [Fibrella sp.]|nr:MarR family transcriptional regulator [Armatimonadota bacterium]
MDKKAGVTGWEFVQVTWAFLNEVFDHAAPVMAQYGLHQKALVLLALLDKGDSPQELAHLLRTPPSTLSHLLKELEDKELIHRSLGVSDKRKFHFVRTERGNTALREGREAINEAIALRLGNLTPEERSIVEQALPLIPRLLV